MYRGLRCSEGHGGPRVSTLGWLSALCLASCLVGLAMSPAARAERSSALGGNGDLLLEGPLVVPRAQLLLGAEAESDAEETRRATPEAFFARVRSRTQFAHLGAVAAAHVARQQFPGLIDQRDGGAPTLPAGEIIKNYSTPTVARLSLPDHRRAVVESLEPMAMRAASGHLEPIDLALRDSGSYFMPTTSQVPVRISKAISNGVRASQSGVSLTPTDAKGEALHGSEGSLQGASVLYANTQTDADTLAKPTSRGFELSTILRSEASPHVLYYRLGVPSGTSLIQHQRRGPIEIVSHGALLGMVMPPTAVDATGANVPVTMGIKGDLLRLNVDDTSREVQYPLAVDPEYYTAEDRSLTGGVFPVEEYKGGTNWVPFHSAGFSEEHTYTKSYSCGAENWEWCDQSWYIEPNREYNANEYAGLQYKTQGESTIYNLEMWVEGENEPSQTTTQVEYNYGPTGEGQDNHVVLSGGEKQERYKYEPLSMTSGYFHNPLETPRNNDVRIMDYTTKHESIYGFWTWIWDARVYVAQEESKHPEAEATSACPGCGFNKSSATIASAGSRTNVLYGSGSWLSPYQGAYEGTVHDPGIGISFAAVDGAGMSVEKFIRNEEGKCLGIQCPQTYTTSMTYNPSMANGDDSIELLGEDAAEMYGYSYATIKVDASKPYNLGFTGMPEKGAEISAAPHTLTVHSTDGTKPTPSSGVRSISVSIDGGTPTELSGASCPEGECTASGEYTLHAENLAEGVNSLVVEAVSNSGEPEAKDFFFDVRHASPVSVGPGAVDPTTGQFMLTASDVSLGGASGVQRSYQSRNVTAGAGGPFGPQWAMSIGGGEGLTVLPSGRVELLSGSGGQTTFTLNSKGEFEAPKGDENLKIEYKSEEHKYVLKDATAGSETVFEQPSGTQNTPPTFGSAFGAAAGVLNRPVGEALDASGDVWVADAANNRIAEFSKAGTLMATYGSEGTEAGQFEWPAGIAVNQKTGDVYVSEVTNNRIDELSSSGAFIRAIGWGVSNGEAKLETCTSSCRAGIAGAGNGELDYPHGMTVDSSGDVWVTEEGNDRVQEFSETGEYLGKFGSAGTGAGQFGDPVSITITGGDFYIADDTDNRIAEFSTSGAFVKAIGWGVTNGEAKLETCTSSCQDGIAGSGNGQFSGLRGVTVDPVSGNLYVSETTNNRVQEITTAGVFVTKFGSGGSGPGQFAAPREVVVSSTGAIYITDCEHASVQEWMRTTWWPTNAKGALPAHTTYTYASVESSEGTTSMQPYEVISPPPKSVECGTKVEELKDGCRALTFKYATETTAKSESEWGEYKGHLTRVMFHVYNPAHGVEKMEEKTVAEYAYDKQGRLRAEWDPRIEKSSSCGGSCAALKTTYGYDSEGHVTSVTPPGQQPWAFTYGTISSDSNTGRLLKVTRGYPKATESEEEVKKKLGEKKETPVNTTAPKISGTPAVGVRVSATEGVWSHSPVVYGYQWEDCNSEGKACTPILGATNANYTPVSGDVGHTLVAHVIATNGWGSVLAETLASASVSAKAGAYTQTVDSGHSLNAVSCLPSTTTCVLSDSAGKAFYATNASSSSSATWKEWSGPSGESPSQAVDCPSSSLCLLADGKETAGGKLYYATSLGGAFSEAYSPSYGVDAIACASSSFCVTGQDAWGYFRYSTSPASTSWTLEEQPETAATAIKGVFCLSSSFCAMADSQGKAHIATSTSQIESSTWKETDVDGSTALNGIACTSTTSCVAVDGAGNELNLTIESSGAATASKHDIDGSTSLTAVTCTGSSTCVAVDSAGNIFISKNSGETWTKQYSLGNSLTSVSCASSSLCATVDTKGNVTVFNLTGEGSEGESRSPQPGSTIEYRVPVSGEGAPHNMSKEELEKWGQKDKSELEDNDPVEATAVYPPDEPQGWPASSYKRATIDYMNSKGLTVNTATPAGAISTSEYNELNEVVRTLSADNRVTALKEGCESVKEHKCKSAEASERLDTKTEYNTEGSEILKVTGPEHTVKLSAGAEVLARAVTHNYYDKGAKEVEEKTKETYNLVTESTSGALLSTGEEKDPRTTVDSYSGQENLGWELRKPTSVTKEPGGLNLTTTTIYERETGNVVETRSPKGSVSGTPTPPVYAAMFGSWGSGGGQFKAVEGVAVDPKSGDVYAADYELNRVEKFSSTGTFLGWIGSEISGSGEGQLSHPESVAVSTSSNVYVGDAGNHRVEEFNSEGKYVRTFGKEAGEGQLGGTIYGLTFDHSGRLWATDGTNHRVDRFSEEGHFEAQFGEHGTGEKQFEEPGGIAASGNDVYVVDRINNDVVEMTLEGKFVRRIGEYGLEAGQLRGPWGIAIDSEGDLFVADRWPDLVEEFNSTGKFMAWLGSSGTGQGQFEDPDGLAMNTAGQLYVADQDNNRVDEWELVPGVPDYAAQFGTKGSENGQLKEPKGVAMAKDGNVFVLDSSNSRVEEFSPSGKYEAKFGSSGIGNAQMSTPYGITVDSKGNIWIADTGNNRVDEFNEKREFVQAFGWGVKNGEAKLEVCTSTCEAGIAGAGSGELNGPKGITVTANGDVYVADMPNNRVQEFTEKGEFVAAFGFGVSNEKAEFEICTSNCKVGIAGAGNGQFNEPTAIAASPDGDVWIADRSNNRVEEFNSKDEYIAKFGTKGSANGQFDEPKAIVIDPAGNVWVADSVNNRVEGFTESGAFLATVGDKGTGNGQFEEPVGVTFAASGVAYVVDSKNNRVEEWTPAPLVGDEGAHDTKTIYYTAKEEAEVTACRNHPEWAGLVCQTEPAAQPGISASPELPIDTATAYNIWDEAETTAEKFGSTTRTKTETYDPAGRALTSEETASPATDQALPRTTIEYNKETGAVEKQSATIKSETKTLTSKYDTLGQLTEYTDAEGNVAKYVYEEGSDGRLKEESEGKGKEAESKQTYSYNTTTGFIERLVDSAAGTFTASYDVEGKMTSEIYPNGMCANTAYNQVGQAISLEYIKTRNCEESKPTVWFSDAIVPSVHGETLQQTSTLSKEKYAYDNAGRLIEAQETPVGKSCRSRLYAYDEEGNRGSETTRESSTETCLTEGGLVQPHIYDSANRLIDPGIEYEIFGNVTKIASADAEHEIVSTYYVDNQVATEKQNEELLEYTYDPVGRTMETVSESEKSKTKSTVVTHYAGAGSSLAWTSEGSEKWTRNIPGIDGALDAIQEAGRTPVLQLHDLGGNIVGTVGDSESETKLVSTYNSTEFGVPNEGTTPPKYAWLGAQGVSSEPSEGSGASTQSGASYVPQVAHDLQTAPIVPPGAFPNGQPGTQYATAVSPTELKFAEEEAARIWQRTEAERQKQKEKEAAEALQKCREEGGCGAETGAAPNPGCNEEVEGCGPDPSSGSNPWGCTAWVSWGHGLHLNEYLAVHGHWECAIAPPDLEIQIALLEVVNGKYKMVDFSKYVWKYPGEEGPTGSEYYKGWTCNANVQYQAWVWARTWDAWTDKTNWYATAEDGHKDVCPEGVEDPTSGPPGGN
jgi:YD repeat-containing protein